MSGASPAMLPSDFRDQLAELLNVVAAEVTLPRQSVQALLVARELPTLLGDPDVEEAELAEALAALGHVVHVMPRPVEATEEEFEVILRWQDRMNRALEAVHQPYRVRMIHPGMPYDMECMESVESKTGHRLKVEKALTWIVFRKRPESEPVPVRRGQVVTR